ncbi:hypothetical protein MKEN_01454200 [Mycena kentingensis (nom. inval.)]|nr:hypothetical protein MKEN_01454200 [Mycena kentingensis (nom. inval.)]
MFVSKLVPVLALALSASSLPQAFRPGNSGRDVTTTGCDTSAILMDLPAGQTQLVQPSTAPKFVALGVGVQNYTCNAATSKFTSVGAVASIFDIACLASDASSFAGLQTTAFAAWEAAPAGLNPIDLSSLSGSFGSPEQIGSHYFIPAASGTGLSPKWDFTTTLGGDAFVVAAKAGNIPAPNTAEDVDWLALNGVSGTLATQVFRIDTVSGQPPTSCAAGDADISVKYTSKYFLY